MPTADEPVAESEGVQTGDPAVELSALKVHSPYKTKAGLILWSHNATYTTNMNKEASEDLVSLRSPV